MPMPRYARRARPQAAPTAALSTDPAIPGVAPRRCRWLAPRVDPRAHDLTSRPRHRHKERRRRWRSRGHWPPGDACCASTASTTGPSSPTARRPGPGCAASASARSGSARRSPTLHSEDEVLDTILHEIAHALVGPQHGHDAVWRAKAREIGCSGERCVSSDSARVPGDWVGRCPAGHEKHRHRAPTRLMSCGECSRRFDPRHLFAWTYRGRPATLPSTYAAQLAALAETRRPAEQLRATPRVGDLVEVSRRSLAGAGGRGRARGRRAVPGAGRRRRAGQRAARGGAGAAGQRRPTLEPQPPLTSLLGPQPPLTRALQHPADRCAPARHG